MDEEEEEKDNNNNKEYFGRNFKGEDRVLLKVLEGPDSHFVSGAKPRKTTP